MKRIILILLVALAAQTYAVKWRRIDVAHLYADTVDGSIFTLADGNAFHHDSLGDSLYTLHADTFRSYKYAWFGRRDSGHVAVRDTFKGYLLGSSSTGGYDSLAPHRDTASDRRGSLWMKFAHADSGWMSAKGLDSILARFQTPGGQLAFKTGATAASWLDTSGYYRVTGMQVGTPDTHQMFTSQRFVLGTKCTAAEILVGSASISMAMGRGAHAGPNLIEAIDTAGKIIIHTQVIYADSVTADSVMAAVGFRGNGAGITGVNAGSLQGASLANVKTYMGDSAQKGEDTANRALDLAGKDSTTGALALALAKADSALNDSTKNARHALLADSAPGAARVGGQSWAVIQDAIHDSCVASGFVGVDAYLKEAHSLRTTDTVYCDSEIVDTYNEWNRDSMTVTLTGALDCRCRVNLDTVKGAKLTLNILKNGTAIKSDENTTPLAVSSNAVTISAFIQVTAGDVLKFQVVHTFANTTKQQVGQTLCWIQCRYVR